MTVETSGTSAQTTNTGGAVAQEAPQPTETQVAEKPAEDAKQDKYHDAFLKLTKKERDLQRQLQEFKAQKQKIDLEMKELQEIRQLKEKAKIDPLAISKHFGIDYKQLTNQILNDERPTTEMELQALKDEVARLRDEKQRERQESEAAQTEKAIASFKNDLQTFIEGQGDKYELIKTFNAYDQVMNTVYEHWNQTGEMIDVDKVADQLEAEMEAEARKLLTLKKLTPKQVAEVTEALNTKEGVQAQADGSKTATKTLTNDLIAQAPPPKSAAYLSDEESKREAAKLLRWS